jgi:putative N6-adenine-specific DNA methylase
MFLQEQESYKLKQKNKIKRIYMSEQFEMIAKTFQGLEEILAEELTALGANDIQIGRRMVSFTGDKRMMYKANFCLRTAIRILKPIKNFTAKDADEVYNQIQAIPWEEYLDVNKTFAIDAVVFSDEFRHSKFVSYKVKDAIVDYFRDKTGKRPSVRINNPDVLLNIHIAQTTCTLSLDSSGESLHRRGYRQEAVEAPLNEVLAAGMILMTGWRGECDLIDPMCGSGTIPVEAALIAKNIAPGVFRKGFAFEKWVDFDADMFDEIYNDDSQEREFAHKIYGYDNNPKANEIATHNIKAAGVSKDIVLKLQPFQQFEQPQEKSIIITNPPYGERISTNDLLGLYQMIGERLKHAFVGNEAWVLSYREECFDQIGLKASQKVPLFNGPLECEFRKYEIFDGKYKEFKSQEEGEEKKEAEGEQAPRFRERKEFKPRREGEFKPRRDGESRPRREGEYKPRREGEYKPRREGGEFKGGDRDRKPRGEFRGGRDSRGPREFKGNREPRIPKKEEE